MKIANIITQLTKDVYEREEVIAVSLLASLAGENIFLYGPPGVAKSLISRRLSKVFDTKNYFEHLMSKFTTPEEVFGPISISELKKDNYIRKVDNYLPTADFAFLDEIWKSSPAILNTLLTIINEKKFKNANKVIDVPLKSLISASNEIPNEDEGLEALYDRFLVRFEVLPLENKKHFETILQNGASTEKIEVEKITNEEIKKYQKEIQDIKLSEDTFKIIHFIREEISQYNKKAKKPIYISDRRWQKSAKLLKASAYFSNRKETNISDIVLLSHCLWRDIKDKKVLNEIIKKTIKNSSFYSSISLFEIKLQIDNLEKEIKKELYYTEDIFDTEILNNKEYFKSEYYEKDWNNRIKFTQIFYIPKEKFKTKGEFNPIDKNGNKLKWIKCDFQATGTCKVEINDNCRRYNDDYNCNQNYNWKNYASFTPKILYKKGDKKKDVNTRLIQAFEKEIDEIIETLNKIESEINTKKAKFKKETNNPFVPEEKIKWCFEGIDNQIDEVNLLKKECDRIKGLL